MYKLFNLKPKQLIDLILIRNKIDITNYKASARIKKLNFENKILFGAVIKKKTTKKEKNIPKKVIEKEIVNESNSNENEKSSETYWMTQYTYLPDFDAKKSSKKEDSKIVVSAVETNLKKIVQKIVRKKKSVKEVPQNLEKFTDCLVPLPVKSRAKKKTSNLVAPAIIPFTSEELRTITDFPLDFGDEKNTIKMLSTDSTIALPSVGKILQATMPEASRRALMQWKAVKIAELGIEGFQELQKCNKKKNKLNFYFYSNLIKFSAHLTKGSQFHLTLQNYFQTGKIPDDRSPIIDTWSSVNSILSKINPKAELVEASIVHPVLKYKGIVDCVAEIENEIHIIEWKKSDRLKFSLIETYDAPIQLCAYLGAINASSKYNLKINKGIVVVAYTDGSSADSYKLDSVELRKYWRAWLLRLQEYWIRYKDGTLPEPI